jgi:hypothetical protein
MVDKRCVQQGAGGAVRSGELVYGNQGLNATVPQRIYTPQKATGGLCKSRNV